MSKYNRRTTPVAATSPVTTEPTPSGYTHEGAPGYARGTQSELYLLAVSNMANEKTFYEAAHTRDNRFVNLVHETTLEDPLWTAPFLRWLRSGAYMRTAPGIGAAEFTRARLTYGLHGLSRHVVNSVLQRGDEPGELLGYWTSRYGRAIPKPLKRGVADAMLRLGTEYNYIKWDSPVRRYRFADILNLTHPGDRIGSAQSICSERQRDLFRYIVTAPHDPIEPIPDTLSMLASRATLLAMPVAERRAVLQYPDMLREAGMTWEALAGWLQSPMDAAAWEAVIPSMGYMALLRNLRNFDQAHVSDDIAARVAGRLANPNQVARSRQFPLRFLSAYRAAPSLRWSWALEQALAHSLTNIPALPGRTLILVDTSGSMADQFSKDGTLARWDAAAIFGIAIGMRCAAADVISFSGGWYGDTATKTFPLRPAESLLAALNRWDTGGYRLNAGTDTAGAVREHYAAHDRVVILTDEQAGGADVDQALPTTVPLYTWNLAGYLPGHTPSGSHNRHVFAGLTDHAFRMIPLLEAGRNGAWPWLTKTG